jgi:hypothetical protein
MYARRVTCHFSSFNLLNTVQASFAHGPLPALSNRLSPDRLIVSSRLLSLLSSQLLRGLTHSCLKGVHHIREPVDMRTGRLLCSQVCTLLLNEIVLLGAWIESLPAILLANFRAFRQASLNCPRAGRSPRAGPVRTRSRTGAPRCALPDSG